MNSHFASIGPALANHLWQSTAFAATVWLVTLLLRNNQARIRYSLWLAASIKFLLPFSLLITLGTLLPRPQHIASPTNIYSAIDTASQPFSYSATPITVTRTPTLKERLAAQLPAMLAMLWLCGTLTVLLIWYKRWRQIHATLKKSAPITEGRELEILRRLHSQSNTHKQIPMLQSQELMEPGVFGIFRPALLWPERLSDQLEDEHIEAILAHESMHVQRHDNLTATLHMFVEAIFWFHPLVWWMESRMIEERERACDEAVVQQGGNPEAYAESLLKACRFCIESPLACVSGITGADLSRRVRSIMTLQLVRMSVSKKLIVAALSVVTVVAPLAFGIVRMLPTYGQILHASGSLPSFEVVSIRSWRRPQPPPPPSGEKIISQRVMKFSPGGGGGQTTDRVHMIIPIEPLIASAYNLPPYSKRILGIPDWAKQDVDQYEIQAKIEESQFTAMQKMTPAQQREQVALMEQSLLADRFKLKAHFETREMPGYALVIAKGGPKLAPAKEGESNRLSALDGEQPGTVMTATAVTLDQLIHSPLFFGGALIVDQTGLKGAYDFTLNFQRDQLAAPDAGQSGPDAPSLFTAIQEQLGLKLVPTKAPVEVIVIDHIEKPTGDAGGDAPANPTTSDTQKAPSGKMVFEVVSIRQSGAVSGPPRFGQTPDGYHSIGLPMFAIFQDAYAPSNASGPLRGDRIVGAPNWLSSERYDVVAKVDQANLADWQKPPLKQAMLRTMLQSMLTERYKVAVHHENKEVPVYNLVPAKGGPKFKQAETTDVDELKRKYPSGGRVTGGGLAVRGPNGTQFYGISMAWLAQTMLPGVAGRPVVDKTGLTGLYDFTLPSAAEPRQPNASSPDDESVFTALPQALGLRLEPAKGQVEMLVIDHVERPTEN